MTTSNKEKYLIASTKETQKIFAQFLIKNSVFDSYMYNVRQQYGNSSLIKSINPMFNMSYTFEYIFSAFTWGDTREGHLFWRDMSHKWNIYITKLNEKC